jgi:hypothetical protein
LVAKFRAVKVVTLTQGRNCLNLLCVPFQQEAATKYHGLATDHGSLVEQHIETASQSVAAAVSAASAVFHFGAVVVPPRFMR